MTKKSTHIEKLLNKLNAADFCKILNSSIRARVAKNDNISDLHVPVTAAVPALATPVATPSSNVEGDDETSSLYGYHSITDSKDPRRKPPKRSRVEAADGEHDDDEAPSSNDASDLEDCGYCHGLGKRPKSRGDDGLTNSQRIIPQPREDMKNYWALCMYLRGRERSQHKIQPHHSRAQQLVSLFANAESRIQQAKTEGARYVLEWRCLAMEVATMYANMKTNEDDLRTSWIRETRKKPDAKRDLTIDWLTGQCFDTVDNFYKLNVADSRRKQVEYWLRIGCPVLAFKNHCGFAALIAPGMRISQHAFRATKAGDFDTPFVQYLIKTFEILNGNLSSMSIIMEPWITTGVAPLELKIERLKETDVRAQSNLSLEHWAQFANPTTHHSSALQPAGCNPLIGCSGSLDPSQTLLSASIDKAWPWAPDSTAGVQHPNENRQSTRQTANPTTPEPESNGATPDPGLPAWFPTISANELDPDLWLHSQN